MPFYETLYIYRHDDRFEIKCSKRVFYDSKNHYYVYYKKLDGKLIRLGIYDTFDDALERVESIIDGSSTNKRKQYLINDLDEFQQWANDVVSKSLEDIPQYIEKFEKMRKDILKGKETDDNEHLDGSLWNTYFPWQRSDD